MRKKIKKIVFVLVVIILASTITNCVFLEVLAQTTAEVAGAVVEDGGYIAGEITKQEQTIQEREKKMTQEEREWFEKWDKYKDIDTF